MDDRILSEAVSAAIRHIGIGTSSSGKIYAFLKQKGYDPSVCKSAVEELIDREYIDDLKAGRQIIRKRSGRKQESRSLLSRRLEAEGIARDKVDILVAELADDKETCVRLFDAYYPDIPTDDASSVVNELMTIANRRGYSAETASSAFRVWLDNH